MRHPEYPIQTLYPYGSSILRPGGNWLRPGRTEGGAELRKTRQTRPRIRRKEFIGGVCIHTGTIPSKAMREAVLHLTAFNERSVYGNSYAVKHDITMSDLLYRCRHVVKTEVDVIRNQMHRNGVEMLFGDASFVDP